MTFLYKANYYEFRFPTTSGRIVTGEDDNRLSYELRSASTRGFTRWTMVEFLLMLRLRFNVSKEFMQSTDILCKFSMNSNYHGNLLLPLGELIDLDKMIEFADFLLSSQSPEHRWSRLGSDERMFFYYRYLVLNIMRVKYDFAVIVGRCQINMYSIAKIKEACIDCMPLTVPYSTSTVLEVASRAEWHLLCLSHIVNPDDVEMWLDNVRGVELFKAIWPERNVYLEKEREWSQKYHDSLR